MPASGAITRVGRGRRNRSAYGGLMARLRQGRANTARGADHFLRETVGRVRYAGATGPLTVQADSSFYTHAIVAACRKMDVRYSITVRQHAGLRNLVEAIPGNCSRLRGRNRFAEEIRAWLPLRKRPDSL